MFVERSLESLRGLTATREPARELVAVAAVAGARARSHSVPQVAITQRGPCHRATRTREALQSQPDSEGASVRPASALAAPPEACPPARRRGAPAPLRPGCASG